MTSTHREAPDTRTPDERAVVTLDRNGDDWSGRLVAHATTRADVYLDERVLDLTLEGEAPGELLEHAGQALDELEAKRLTADRRARDGEQLESGVAGDVVRVLEVLEDAAGVIPTRVVADRAELPIDRALAALEQGNRDAVIACVPADVGTYWSLQR